jgi:hypothetical protein
MNRTRWLVGGFVLVVAAGGGLTGIATQGQETARPDSREIPGGGLTGIATQGQETARPDSREIQRIQADVAQSRPVALSMVVQPFTGPLTQENVETHINFVMDEFVRQDLDFSLGSFQPRPVVVLYEAPTGKERVRMAIGLLAPSHLQVKAPLKLTRIRFPKAVRHLHVGPYDELGGVYRVIAEGAQRGLTPNQRAEWPVVLQVLDDPTRVESKKLRKIIYVPVK